MDTEAAYRWDQYYRLEKLTKDPEVGAQLQVLLDAEKTLDTVKTLIMGIYEAPGLVSAKEYLKSLGKGREHG